MLIDTLGWDGALLKTLCFAFWISCDFLRMISCWALKSSDFSNDALVFCNEDFTFPGKSWLWSTLKVSLTGLLLVLYCNTVKKCSAYRSWLIDIIEWIKYMYWLMNHHFIYAIWLLEWNLKWISYKNLTICSSTSTSFFEIYSSLLAILLRLGLIWPNLPISTSNLGILWNLWGENALWAT